MVVLAARNDGEAAVAAFKLGAQDYIVQHEGYLSELVFSLNSLLRLADTDRLNQQLTRELAELNRSLETQVAARTQELSSEVAVRQKAERHAAEHAARLQILSKRLFKIQEDERRAIARELHDQVGQMLTGLKMQLESMVKVAAASKGGTQPPFLKDGLAESLTLATELMAHVRELTQQFRPRILDDLGLRAALEWHARLFQRQTNVNASVDVTLPQARLPVELEIAVFRIVQEALTNVARHAGCAEAVVTVTHAAPAGPADGEGKVLVDITDRGRGFDLEGRAGLAQLHWPDWPDRAGDARRRHRGNCLPRRSGHAHPRGISARRRRRIQTRPDGGPAMNTVVLADDHEVVRKGVRSVLEGEKKFTVVAEVADGLAAVAAVEQHRPDLLFLDLSLPRLHGIEVLRQVRTASPATRVLILSMHNDEPYVIEALRGGAMAYLLKGSDTAEILHAANEVLANRRFLSAPLSDWAITALVNKPAEPADALATLSPREREVLQYAAEGLSNAEIAEKLFLSPRTTETHRTNLMRKLNLRTQTDLVRFAIRKVR